MIDFKHFVDLWWPQREYTYTTIEIYICRYVRLHNYLLKYTDNCVQLIKWKRTRYGIMVFMECENEIKREKYEPTINVNFNLLADIVN